MTNRDYINAARFAYKYGEPFVTDKEFDKLVLESDEYKNWEDVKFEEVRETLLEIGWDVNIYLSTLKIEQKEEDMKLQRLFPVKTSMEMLTDEYVFKNKYISQFEDIDLEDALLMMYKIDGWGISVYYEPGNPVPIFAKTRGRNEAQYTVITKLMQLVAPKVYVDKLTEVTGELALKKESLEGLRNKYPDKNFINVRNSISSFVYKTVNIEEDFRCLTFFAFNKEEELSTSVETKIEDIKWLEDSGFNTPPYMVISKNQYEQAFKIMEENYRESFSHLYEADGAVVQNNYKDIAKKMKSVTSLGIPNLVALKYGEWSQEELIGVVKEVIFPSGKVRNGCVIVIYPLKNKLGNTIRRVNGYNLATVLRYKIDKGSYIKIGCHSQQNIVILGIPTKQEIERMRRE